MEFLKKSAIVLMFSVLTIDVSAQINTALIEKFSQSYNYEKEGELVKATNVLKDVYNEESYEINLRLGWLTYLQGKFSESIPYYEKCLSIFPLSSEARLGLVYPAASMGNWTLVEKMYVEILNNDPSNSLVNYRMGVIYYEREEYNTALNYMEKVVNLYPFDYDGLLMLGWINFKLGKFREATVLFNKVLLNKPSDKSALEGLSYIK